MSQEQWRAEPHLWKHIRYQTIPQPQREAPRWPVSIFETFRDLQKKDTSDHSAATKAFETPELLKCVLYHLSAEEFMDVQTAHPQFVAVAMLFRDLRYKFYLEEDPALQQDPKAIPRMNPLFAKAVIAGGWHFDIARCNKDASRSWTLIRCNRMRESEREGQPRPLVIPLNMILFQPAPQQRVYILHDKIPYGTIRRWWHEDENKFVVDLKEVGQNLQKNIDAVLGAKAVPIVRKVYPHASLCEPRGYVHHDSEY